MEISVKKYLESIGIDIEPVMYNIGDNMSLYLKLLKRFVQDKNYPEYYTSYNRKDYEKAEQHLHTFKGMCANLGMIKLMECSNELLVHIRNQEYGLEAKLIVEKLNALYEGMIESINEIN